MASFALQSMSKRSFGRNINIPGRKRLLLLTISPADINMYSSCSNTITNKNNNTNTPTNEIYKYCCVQMQMQQNNVNYYYNCCRRRKFSYTSHASFLSPAFNTRLEIMVARHNELLQKIEDSPDEGYLHGKEMASLSQAVALHEKKQKLETEENSIHELLEELDADANTNANADNGGSSTSDDYDDMTKECMAELEQIQSSRKKLEKKVRIAILPKDENDYQSDAIVEIRAGTGGDEATLFASELRQAYEKTAKAMKWECDIMSESITDLGGIKEAVLSISGRSAGAMHFATEKDEDENVMANLGPYGLFKYERYEEYSIPGSIVSNNGAHQRLKYW